MIDMSDQEQRNIKQEYNNAMSGLNMDNVPSQIAKGKLTYALNAMVENFDGNSVNYQNEPGNEECIVFPEGWILIGKHHIVEQNKHIFFLVNGNSTDSQIGYMENNDCVYRLLVQGTCLNFSINHPILKVVHRITNCSTEIYWTDGYNPRRYLDMNNIPRKLKYGTDLCDPQYTDELDCNKLNIQPDFTIPQLTISEVLTSGNITAGTYQFAVQYCDSLGNPFTSYYSVTNPVPIHDPSITTVNFDYPVGKSIVVQVDNLDISGLYDHFNIAVIKTINQGTTVELVGTYFIDSETKFITYSGQSATNIRLSMADIFEKYPYYEIAQDLTTAQDILIWDQLTSIDRINYQKIANRIRMWWETWRIPPTESYADEVNAALFRGYMRDEVYPFEIVFLLANGKQTDRFHIPGRAKDLNETMLPDVPDTNPDFVGTPTYYSGDIGYSPYWKIYNTASVSGTAGSYTTDPSYKGPYQYGEFAYWESTDEYPCNEEVWGELAGQKIRHHKFPDVAVSPIFESRYFANRQSMVMSNEAVFPIGVGVDPQQIYSLIYASDLTAEQKAEIVGFKIVRGDRTVNKSVVAKGMLRNVNTYKREDKDYYFPNYPYNDLREDPFINSSNNAYLFDCEEFIVEITELHDHVIEGFEFAEIEFIDCNTNKVRRRRFEELGTNNICSIGKPRITYGKGKIIYMSYDEYKIEWYQAGGAFWNSGVRIRYEDYIEGIKEPWLSTYSTTFEDSKTMTVKVVPGTYPEYVEGNARYIITRLGSHKHVATCAGTEPLPAVTDKYRQIFNSPETSFGKPFLGDILKLEGVMFGKGLAHFVEVKDNAKYKLITKETQIDILNRSTELGAITSPFDVTAMFAAYQAHLTIALSNITRRNFAYSFNSIASYDYFQPVPNGQGVKQRNLDIARYLIPAVVSTGDDKDINNYQRESSVFLRTDLNVEPVPFPDSSPNMLNGTISILTDQSRFSISEKWNCGSPGKEEPIEVVSYYASIKREFLNQWGQIYSYEALDTGFQWLFGKSAYRPVVFGGDTFINKFAFKTKLPFFIDNRVGAPDDSDIFYDEIGNVGYPKYWHSARSIVEDYYIDDPDAVNVGPMKNLVSYKAHNFDCPNIVVLPNPSPLPGETTSTTTTSDNIVDRPSFYDGYFYLFAYGVPSFYCESTYNVDMRQAFNNREGDFWPHVTNSIPDDWVQEKFVSIANDNTYYYNTTYSKQNKENFFSYLPFDWEEKLCFTNYPFRAIYSDMQSDDADNRVNNWRIYRATSYFDFPQNFGKLVSLDGIQNRAVLARFENKTLLYNHLLTMDTSNPQSAYLGNPTLFKGSPPIDFADTDLGYAGSQHKMMLKIPNGQISIDAKRGNVFLINGTQAVELSGFGSGMKRFLKEHLPFEILRYFPDHEEEVNGEKVIIPGVNIDNHFNGLGLHAVYDSKYNRVLITKLDYVPRDSSVKYDPETKSFYTETIIDTDSPPPFISPDIEPGTWIAPPIYPVEPTVICCNPVINLGERITGIHAGHLGERSITPNYEYICIQGGLAGVAIWKKIVLTKTDPC